MTYRLLVVEDDPISQDILVSLLQTRGYTVDTIDNGFGALSMVQSETYDLIFVDYHLPEMDGYALARLIRTIGEKTNMNMKMVAITADRYGLAGRRGVDSIFDKTLAKPIEPDVLFTCIDELLNSGAIALNDSDAFLESPKPSETESTGSVLWRSRGITTLPSAAVFPAPAESERANLAHCFRLVDPEEADCFILLKPAGLTALEAERRLGISHLKPLIVFDQKLADIADACFDVSDGESWTSVANKLMAFASRRQILNDEVLASMDAATRIAAYLFVADRALCLQRDREGRANVVHHAGFAIPNLIDAVKQLVTQGIVNAKTDVLIDGKPQQLIVTLTSAGKSFLCQTEDAMTSARHMLVKSSKYQ